MRYDFPTNFILFLGDVCDMRFVATIVKQTKNTSKTEKMYQTAHYERNKCWKFVGVHNFSVGRGFEYLLTQLLFLKFPTNLLHFNTLLFRASTFFI